MQPKIMIFLERLIRCYSVLDTEAQSESANISAYHNDGAAISASLCFLENQLYVQFKLHALLKIMSKTYVKTHCTKMKMQHLLIGKFSL